MIEKIVSPVDTLVFPGGTMKIEIRVSHCQGVDKIVACEVEGQAMEGGVVKLTPGPISSNGKERSFSGNVKLQSILQDEPVDLSKERLTITVKTPKKSVTGEAKFDIQNFAVSTAYDKAGPHSLFPGETLSPKIIVFDQNGEHGSERQEVKLKNLAKDPFLEGKGFGTHKFADPKKASKDGEYSFELTSAIKLTDVVKDNDGDGSGNKEKEYTYKLIETIEPSTQGNDIITSFKDVIKVIIKNKDPVIDDESLDVSTLSPAACGQRVLTIKANVTDKNGAADIGEVKAYLPFLGPGTKEYYPMKRALLKAGGKKLNDQANYHLDVPVSDKVDCTAGCFGILYANDKDDKDSAAIPELIEVYEKAIPPEISADAFIYKSLGTKEICKGQELTFQVLAFDENRQKLSADLVINGTKYKMKNIGTNLSSKSTTFQLKVTMEKEGQYNYHYEVSDCLSSTRSPVDSFEVKDCKKPLPEVFFGSGGTGVDSFSKIDSVLPENSALKLNSSLLPSSEPLLEGNSLIPNSVPLDALSD